MNYNNMLLDLSYELNEQNIWVKNHQEFYYSDGDLIENYLLDSLKQCKDVSVFSSELQNFVCDWPSLYHFSPLRSNLLAPFYKNLKGKKILEIGCGCGAITRFLGEAGAEILSVEGSLKRAEIARERCRDLKNVEIVCSSSDQLSLLGEFDYVMLIGVLEYSHCFLGTQGHVELLKQCYNFLKKGGQLFLAIENKLGLKYLAGAKEDHIGKAMIGVNSTYEEDGVCTYGREELKGFLKEAGYGQVDEFLPFPDYKLPVTIFSPKAIHYSAEFSLLASESVSYDPQPVMYPTFSMEMAMTSIWENKLGWDLAGSFLMVASKENVTKSIDNVLAFYFASNRSEKFVKCKEFVLDRDIITVNEKPHPLCVDRSKVLENNQPFLCGKTLFWSFLKIINKDGWSSKKISTVFLEWKNYLEREVEKNIQSLDTLISKKYIDATIFNLMIDEEKNGVFYDLEWDDGTQVDFGYVFFRNIINSLFKLSSCAEPQENQSLKILDIVKNVFLSCGLDIVDERFFDYIEREKLLHIHVTGRNNAEDIYRNIENRFINVRYSIENLKVMNDIIVGENNKLIERTNSFEQRANDLQQEVNNLYLSTSWKITKPIRSLMKIIKK